MRFKLNGTQIECDNGFYATYKTTAGPDSDITFYARWGDKEVDFQLFTLSNSDITPGQYVFGPNKAYAVEIWPTGTSMSSGGPHYSYIAGSITQNPTIAGSGQITIQEINAEYIKGSFDFTTAVNPNTNLSMAVTNGEFKLKR